MSTYVCVFVCKKYLQKVPTYLEYLKNRFCGFLKNPPQISMSFPLRFEFLYQIFLAIIIKWNIFSVHGHYSGDCDLAMDNEPEKNVHHGFNMFSYSCEFTSSSSSPSCHATSMDFPELLSLPVSVVLRSRKVFQAISCISTERLYIGSSWSSCLCSSMERGPQDYIAYEFVLFSLAVSLNSSSTNFDSFRDGL